MENNFEGVEDSKRNALLNSGYSEFSKHGIKRSSLNKILKGASVSKGFFYHYFKDKDDFLDYLIRYGIGEILKKMNNEKLIEDPDFIHRLQLSATYKNELVRFHPDIMLFITKMYTEENNTKLKTLSEELSGDFARRVMTENIDYSLFRDDIPIAAAMKIVSRYINQLALEIESMIHKLDFEQISNWYEQELEDLKLIVYKKENNNGRN